MKDNNEDLFKDISEPNVNQDSSTNPVHRMMNNVQPSVSQQPGSNTDQTTFIQRPVVCTVETTTNNLESTVNSNPTMSDFKPTMVQAQPTVNPQPTMAQAQPTMMQAQPAVNPQPTMMQAQPAVNPQPTMTQAQPTVNPQPTMTQAQPTVNPQPTMMQAQPAVNPQPTMTQAQPTVNPQPTMTQAQPTVNPQPTMTQAQPTVNPQPTTMQAQPTVNPQPTMTQAQPAVNPQQSTVIEGANGNSNTLSSKKSKKLIIGAVAAMLVLIGLIAFILLNGSNKVKLAKSFKLLTEYNEYFKFNAELKDSKETDVSVNVKMKSNIKELESFTDIINKVSVDYRYATNSVETFGNVTLNKEGSKLFGIDALINETTGYLFLDKIFNKHIELPELVNANISGYDMDDFVEAQEYLLDILKNSIDNSEFKTRNATIIYNGEEKKVKEVYLEYTQIQIWEKIKVILSKIEKDKNAPKLVKEYIEVFADISFSSASLQESIDEMKENSAMYEDSKIGYSIYTSKIGSEVYGVEFSVVEYEEKTSLSYISSDKTNIVIKDTYSTSEIIIEEKDGLNISVLSDKTEVAKFTVNKKDLTTKITGELMGDLKGYSFILDIKTKEVKKGEEYTSLANLKLISPEGDIELTFDSVLKNKAIIDTKVGESVLYDELTEDDMIEIQEKFMEILAELMPEELY